MDIIKSTVIYLLVILTATYLFFLAIKTKKKSYRRFYLFLSILIPVLLAGFRYATGTDYFSYINAFNRVKLGYSTRSADLEKGFNLLNTILVKIGLNSQSILYAASLIMMFFVVKALVKREEIGYISLGFATFMFMFYQSSFNIIRMMIAIAIVLYNYTNIENKKPVKYIIFSLVAASFHISALITIPIYWIFNLLRMQKNLIRRISIYSVMALVIIFFGNILEFTISTITLESMSYYQRYALGEGNSIILALKRFILYVPLVIPGLISYKGCKELDKNFPMYYSLLVIGLIIKTLATFQTTYIDRLADYFIVAAVMVVPVYMKQFSRKKNYLMYMAIPTYLVIFWFYIYFVINNHGTVPYQWIFQ